MRPPPSDHWVIVHRLRAQDVPEVASGAVGLRAIACVPGRRTGLAGFALTPDLDPVSACVSPRAWRITRLRFVASLLLLPLAPQPRWHEAVPPGSGCLPPRCAAGQLPLALPILVHGERLFMIGDGADPRRVHESRDGRTWASYEHNARWGQTYGAAHASYRGALWRMGGFTDTASQRILQNDVWRSVDGRRWERLLSRAPWPPRAHAHLVVFRDTLLLIGGEPNDRVVWYTVDGVTWGSRPAPGLPGLNPQGMLAFRGSLWILGHGTWDSATNDVWSSADGTTWTRVSAGADWPARTHAGFAVLHDHLWVFGGAGRRDVWSSADGVRWLETTEPLPGPPRAANHSVVFQDGLWVFGGKTGGAGGTGFWDGVWFLK